MKIMVIADEEAPALYDYFKPEILDGIDLILSCGDLEARYLSFLVTYAHCPLVYVPGNHDKDFERTPPEGCVCADGTIVKCGGVRILGLGGSMRYNRGPQQYTEKEMRRRVRRLRFKLWRNRGFDILLTHSPARGCGDGDDLAHRGFEVFNRLMDQYQPKLMACGHQHQRYDYAFVRERQHNQTRVVNGCGMAVVDVDFENGR